MLVRFLSSLLATKLGSLLSIRSNEWEGVIYFFSVMLLFSFGASFARSIGMTLLVEHLGGDKLPLLFISIDLLVMVGSLIYAHYTKTATGLGILGFFFLVTAFFTLVTQVLFWFASQEVHTFKWVYGFFFIGFAFFNILILIHASSVIASYFTAVQAKRVTSVINTGIPIGSILGGSVLVTLLKIFDIRPHYLTVVLALTCLGAFWLLRVINTQLNPVRSPEYKSTKTPVQELAIAFKFIINSRLMIFMSLGLVLFVIGNKLLEYQYQAIIYPNLFPTITERTAFFASYEIIANVAWLCVQLFLTSRVIVKWGVGASNVIYPVLSAIVGLGLFIYFCWWSTGELKDNMTVVLSLTVITQFINQEMRGALRTPVNNLLFNAIPPNQWGVNKAFLNGIVFPCSTLIAVIFLILITGTGVGSSFTELKSALTPEQVNYLLPLIVLVVSLIGIVVAIPQWFAYNDGVFGLLNRDLFNQRTDIGSGSRGTLKQVIEQKLSNSDRYQVVAALEMIRVLKLNYFVNQIGNLLLKTQNFQIKESCLNTLTALTQTNSGIAYLIEVLRIDKDPQILSLVLKSLARFKTINFNNTIEKLLNHPSPAVFVEACIYLHHHPQYRARQIIESRLLARLEQSTASDTVLYLYALGQLRQPHHSDVVLPFLDSDQPEICLAAFTAYTCMLKGELNASKNLLIEVIQTSPSKEMKIVALEALKECEPLADWIPIVRLLGARDRTLVNKAKELLKLNLTICKTVLIKESFSRHVSVQERFELLSLIYARLNQEQRDHLQVTADEALKQFVQINSLIKLHQAAKGHSKVHDLIAKVLQEIAENHLLNVLTVITYASGQGYEFFQRVSRGLFSLSRANQGNALEVLSNAGEKYLVNRVLKYFDERMNDVQAFNYIHLALFGEPLGIDESNYVARLLALDNPLLKACLYYMQQEKTGVFRQHRSVNKKVQAFLTETTTKAVYRAVH